MLEIKYVEIWDTGQHYTWFKSPIMKWSVKLFLQMSAMDEDGCCGWIKAQWATELDGGRGGWTAQPLHIGALIYEYAKFQLDILLKFGSRLLPIPLHIGVLILNKQHQLDISTRAS